MVPKELENWCFMLTKPRLIWISWLAVGGVIELITLFNVSKEDTLSENVWALFTAYPLTVWLVGGFLIWLTLHFLTRGKV